MKNLTNNEVAKLLFWAETTGKSNWGVWGNYPLSGCTYTSIEDCQIFIKFDKKVEYRGETFTHIVSSRKYCKDNRITLAQIQSLYNQSNDTLLNELLDNESLNQKKYAEQERERAKLVREKAKTIEFYNECKTQVYADLNYKMDFYCINRSLHGKEKVGDSIVMTTDIYFGSSATAIYDESERNILKSFEDRMRKEEFNYTIVSKSGSGKTKYAVMNSEDIGRLKKLVFNYDLVELLVQNKIKSAKNFKTQYCNL